MRDMQKSGWLIFWALLAAVCVAPSVRADEAAEGMAANMPPRERELIDTLMAAR